MSENFYLFALPSIAEGVGSVIDLAGSWHVYNESRPTGEADARAIYSDWKAVGKDIRTSMDTVVEEHSGKA
jgi:hypothetical protein